MTTLPAWMDPKSPDYDPNWMNRSLPLPETIWTRYANGQVHQTNNRQHLARWIAENGAVIIEPPTEAGA